MSTQLDASEVASLRMRAIEVVARNATHNEWRDVDILIDKARMIADFCMDARTRSPVTKRTPGQPKKVKKIQV